MRRLQKPTEMSYLPLTNSDLPELNAFDGIMYPLDRGMISKDALYEIVFWKKVYLTGILD